MSDSLRPMDCSLPGSSVHGILQARILEWVAIPFSRASSQFRDQPADFFFFTTEPPGKPYFYTYFVVVHQHWVEASLLAQMVKNLPVMWETGVRSLGQEDPLEKEMATRSSILAWETLWIEEPGELQSMGSQKNWTQLSD